MKDTSTLRERIWLTLESELNGPALDHPHGVEVPAVVVDHFERVIAIVTALVVSELNREGKSLADSLARYTSLDISVEEVIGLLREREQERQ